ncbi:MAG: PAS domain-containing protein [Candidatus Hydrogenedentes bacterium]|nr:PAS domain-containing protein [Candidatus Hydrogenedentota bacterium]
MLGSRDAMNRNTDSVPAQGASHILGLHEALVHDGDPWFAKFTQHLPGLAWIKDLEGRYVFVNDAAERAFRRPRAEILGRSDDEIFPPETAAQFRKNDRRAAASPTGTQTIETLEHDDGIHHSIVSKFPIPGPDGKPILVGGMAIDVTERVKAVNALRESEERLRLATQTGKVGTWDWDIATNHVTWSDSLYPMHGVTSAEFNPTVEGFKALVHPDDRAFVSEAIRRALEEDATYELEFRVLRPDSKVVWIFTNARVFRDQGRPVRMIGAATDITRQKRYEEALRVARRQLQMVTDTMAAAVTRCSADGRYLWVNKGYAAWLGRTPKEIAGRPIPEIIGMEAYEAIRPHIERVLAGEKVEYEVETNFLGLGRRWVRTTYVPTYGDAGKPDGWVGVVHDVTRHKELESALREANETLERHVAERTADLRALTLELTETEHRERKRIARLLHDEVQQLLVGVKIQTSFARSYPGQTGPLLEAIRLTDEAIAACHALVAGLSPPLLRDADLAEALQWLAKQMAERYRLQVEIQMDDPPPFLSEELRSLIFEAVREMLFNVVKHAGVDRATVTLAGDDEQMCLIVSDEGRGCDPAVLDQPGPESFGLFSIRERVAGFGGRLQAIAAPGEGCSFRVCVPRSVAGAPAGPSILVPRTKNGSDASRDGKLRVLLADDHRIVRQALARLLDSQPDMQVVAEASDGLEALELARKLGPDVVVMDISMPRMSGLEVTRHIRSEMPGVRVVGLSVYEYEDMAEAMREAGAHQYLHKGGPIEELFAALRGA